MPVLGFTLYGALALVREFVAARVEESVSLYLISLMKSRALLQNSLMIRILKLLRDQVRNEISSKLLAGRE